MGCVVMAEMRWRVVCAIFDRHPTHAMHLREVDTYPQAMELCTLLDSAHHPKGTLGEACAPHRVQIGQIAWEDVPR